LYAPERIKKNLRMRRGVSHQVSHPADENKKTINTASLIMFEFILSTMKIKQKQKAPQDARLLQYTCNQ